MPQDIPIAKVWKIKSFFATARDRLQWVKVWHRTLYTVGKDTTADSNACMQAWHAQSRKTYYTWQSAPS